MLVGDLGEFGLIDALAQVVAEENSASIKRNTEHGFKLRLSIGDDAAAWDSPAGTSVITTDTMVEDVHFRLDHSGFRWGDLGWKSLVTSLSDVAAMGCLPSYALITIGLRRNLQVDSLVEMYRGILEACRLHGGAVVGGDVVQSSTFFLTVALEGISPASSNGNLLTRSAASVGDKIAVTGSLGCSAAGLRMMMETGATSVAKLCGNETADHLQKAHNRPVPRIKEGTVLVRQGVLAAIDISDGLIGDLRKMCKASGVGAVVCSNRVPIDAFLVKAYPAESVDLALWGGEDYELLFTAPQPILGRVETMLDIPITTIGDIVEGPPLVRVLGQNGNTMKAKDRGWDHFID